MSELLKSGMVGNPFKSKEEIIESWEASGLLKGLEGPIRDKCAMIMDETAQLMLNSYIYIGDSRLDTVMFPIVRRVISSIDKGEFNYLYALKDYEYNDIKEGLVELLDAKFIIHEASRIFDKNLEHFEFLYGGDEIDIEAESCAYVSLIITQKYLMTFKNKNIINGETGWYVAPKPLNEK